MKNHPDALRGYFSNEEEVVLAYLFGSRADGVVGPMSDYGIGTLVRSPSAESASSGLFPSWEVKK